MMPKKFHLFCCLLVTCWVLQFGPRAFAQRDLKDIPPTDPELERKALKLAEGFEINLFAADPRIAKPIQMNWDPAGRMWLATSETYPHIKPGEKANDKILISDRDQDGVADKTTVFAGLYLYAEGVSHSKPRVSRAAAPPWVTGENTTTTPTGLHRVCVTPSA